MKSIGPTQRSRILERESMGCRHLFSRSGWLEIYASDYHKSGSLQWFEPNQGYGFPVALTLRDLLIGDDVNL
jgi:hypothetical protein